jgi:hypothetical protein
MRESILSICMAAGFILFAQSAMAGTQVYVNFGFPVILFEMGGEGPYEDDIWIEGHYINGYPNYIWVPGYWTPAHHNHAVCIQRPPVYRHFHRNAVQGSYCHTPRQSSGNYRGRGSDGCNNSWREDSNRQPRNNGQGNGHYNDKGKGNSNHQQNPPQGQYNPQRHDGYRTDNNWMNNINNKVIKRQIHQTPQD